MAKKEKQPKITPTQTAAKLPEHGPIDPENGKEILLSLKEASISFGSGKKTVEVVHKATFDIYKGETFSLVGESGSGKTTIGRAVIRVNPLSHGEIDYKGVRISGKIPHSLDREVIRNIQMVFQDPAASLNERATVDYIVSEGLYNFHLFKNEADRVSKVENIIKEVGLLPEHLTRYPHEFSGGQRQRIGLARAMVMEPSLIVADEPISALDVSIRAQVLNLLKKFQAEQDMTCLFIAHDLSIVRFISDRIGVIYKGDIVEIAEAEELFNFPLHSYTQSLISAIPLPDPEIEKKKLIDVYQPPVYEEGEEVMFVDVGNHHFVRGNAKEIEEFKRIRSAGETLSVVKVSQVEQERKDVVQDVSKEFLEKPLYDTGSSLYFILSLILWPFGYIAGAIFKKKNWVKNGKACTKGAIIGTIIFGAIIVIWLLFLLLALI